MAGWDEDFNDDDRDDNPEDVDVCPDCEEPLLDGDVCRTCERDRRLDLMEWN